MVEDVDPDYEGALDYHKFVAFMEALDPDLMALDAKKDEEPLKTQKTAWEEMKEETKDDKRETEGDE